MPTNNKKDGAKKTVKKFTLKTEVKAVPDVTKKEAEATYNLMLKVMSTKKVDFKAVLKTCDLEQTRSISDYVKRDKSNISVKVERLGLYMPELLQLQRLRDMLDHTIEKGADLIHDAIVRECQKSDDTFDAEHLKSLIDRQLGKLSPEDMEL